MMTDLDTARRCRFSTVDVRLYSLILAVTFFTSFTTLAQEPPATEPPAPATPANTPAAAATAPEAAAPPEAPFGLKWLASKQDVAQMGVTLKRPMDTDFGASYVAAQLPKELPDLHYAVLSFGDDDHLIRITTIGTGFDADDDGTRIKERYKELDDLLQKKYGAGKTESHVDKNCEGDSFARCLGAKRISLYTTYSPRDMWVELSAFVEGGQTHWRMIFEYLPGMQRLERERKQEEERAL